MAARFAGCYTPRDPCGNPLNSLYPDSNREGLSCHIMADGVVRVLLLKATFDKSYDLTCEICGCEMIEQKCKIKCPNCGFTRDCSDP